FCIQGRAGIHRDKRARRSPVFGDSLPFPRVFAKRMTKGDHLGHQARIVNYQAGHGQHGTRENLKIPEEVSKNLWKTRLLIPPPITQIGNIAGYSNQCEITRVISALPSASR